MLSSVCAHPWNPTGTVRVVREVPAASQEAEGVDRTADVRGMPIQRKHLRKYGYSDNSPKCRDIRDGRKVDSRRGHTKGCRARVINRAKDDDEFKDQAEAAEKRKKGNQEPEDDEGREAKKPREDATEEEEEDDPSKGGSPVTTGLPEATDAAAQEEEGTEIRVPTLEAEEEEGEDEPNAKVRRLGNVMLETRLKELSAMSGGHAGEQQTRGGVYDVCLSCSQRTLLSAPSGT